MKFFIASPWRNADAVKTLASALVARGHAAYSFLDNGANLVSGMPVCDEFRQFSHSIADWEGDPLIKRVFESEMQALRDSDVLVLLEPAGHSSLAEAGIAYGMGKGVVLVGSVEHPEVVYFICGSRYPNADAFIRDLDTPAA